MTTTGRKKPAPKRPEKKLTKKEQEEKALLSNEAKGFALLFLGILFIYFILSEKNGFAGGFVKDLLTRLFGTFGRMALSISLVVNGGLLLAKKRGAEAWVGFLSFVLTCAAAVNERMFSPYSLSDVMLYGNLWSTTTRGGFICGLCGKVLRDSLQPAGAYLLLFAAAIISFIYIFKTSFVVAVKNGADKARVTAAEIKSLIPASEFDEKQRRRPNREAPSIDMRKTKTVLETKQGDKLIYVKKSALPKQKAIASDFWQVDSPKNAKKQDGSSKILDDFSESKQPASKKPVKKQPRKTEADFFNDIPEPFIPSAGTEKKEAAKEDAVSPKEEKVTQAEAVKATENMSKIIDKSLEVFSEEIPYKFPSYSLLDKPAPVSSSRNAADIKSEGAHLIKALDDFGVEATITEITTGPAVTRFEVALQSGTRVSKIANLSDDIAYALAAKQVRIEAPIPGKSAVGIEIPSKEPLTVKLSQVINDPKFVSHKSPLAVALGQTLTGNTLVMDITRMPHMLIAGATGSGKSVCINIIITSILYHSSPKDVRMILIDPKQVELSVYNGIPHLLIPVVTNPKEASGALGWAVREMDARYQRFSQNKVKDIKGFNEKAPKLGEEQMPHVVLIIDELNDLMMLSPQQVENSICRLAQLARAAGIHLILATQRPSVNVITGTIKANIPSRISFAVTSQVDSRTILDMSGAEKLLGRGDMLYKPMEENQPIRAQCAFVSEDEVERIVDFIKENSESAYDEEISEEIKNSVTEDNSKKVLEGAVDDDGDDEALIKKAVEIGYQNKNKISTSLIQRKLRLGYARAGRIMDELEERGYVSPADGSRPREILVSYEEIFGE